MDKNDKKTTKKESGEAKKGIPRTEISSLVAELVEKGASREELIEALEAVASGTHEKHAKNSGNTETSENIDLQRARDSKHDHEVKAIKQNSGQTSADEGQPLVELNTLPHKEEFLLDMTNSNYSKETVYNYDRDLAVFEGFLTICKIQFSEIDKKVVMQYKGFLQAGNYLLELKKIGWERLFLNSTAPGSGRAGKGKTGPLASKSINRMLSSLRSFLRFLIDFDLEPRPIAPEAVKLVKLERKISQVAELPDLIRLVECPTEFEKDKLVASRNRAILELLFSTGMRISELTKLDREQVNVSEDQGKLYVTGKGKKQRFVYLTPRAQKYISEYLETRNDPYPALLIPYRGGRAGRRAQRLSVNYIQSKIAEYRRRLGIIVPTSAHSLRHGFATYLAEQGASPAAIQILLGHESLNTTDKYVHASDKFAAETHKKYHPLYES